MTWRAWLTALALLAAVPGAAYSQDRLTLDQAITTALLQNAAIRASHSASAEAAAHVAEARSGYLPRVSFVESWQRSDQPVFVFSSLLSARRFGAADFALDSLNHPSPTGLFRASVGVEQLLFDGGRQRASVAGASLRHDMADAATDQAAAALELATTRTFGRVMTADALRRAAESGLSAAQEDLARAERRRDAGMATDADVLSLVVHVADLQERAIQARGDSEVGRAELNRLMGSPIDRQFQLEEPQTGEGASGDALNASVLLAEADANRPELRRAASAEQLAAAGRREARAALVPQVAAQAAFDVTGSRFNDRQASWLVGGELRWTFSTGGAELARMRAAAEAAARARAERDDARAAIQVDVISALRRLESARAREAVGRASVDQARESQRITRDRFSAGLAGVNDVLQASTAVLDAETRRTSALVDSLVGDALLRQAVGRRR